MSQNGHGGNLLFSVIDIGALSIRISVLQARQDNAPAFPPTYKSDSSVLIALKNRL